jgi:hypothetical protein
MRTLDPYERQARRDQLVRLIVIAGVMVVMAALLLSLIVYNILQH